VAVPVDAVTNLGHRADGDGSGAGVPGGGVARLARCPAALAPLGATGATGHVLGNVIHRIEPQEEVALAFLADRGAALRDALRAARGG
jgi:hypothetical protein